MPVYEVKPETGNGRSRVLHRNMLLQCSYLLVETHVKSSVSCHAVSMKTDRQQPLQEKATGSTDGGVADFTPHQLQEFCRVVQDLVEQDVGAERNPSQVDDPGPEGEVGGPELDSVADGDADDDDLPLRPSQRLSRPPLRVTYDVPGQPSFQPNPTTGMQGITVSYPQQLWKPVQVP